MLKTRTLLALAVLVVAAGAAVYKVTRKNPYSQAAGANSPYPTFTKAGPNAPDELEIDEPGKPQIVVKKEGAEWKTVKPAADRADQHNVEAALDTLTQLKLRDVIAEQPTSYDKVGTKDDEVVKVIPRKAGKPLVTLLVGKTTNVRLENDPRVWTTSGLRRWDLVREPKMWRDRDIAKVETAKLDRVELVYADGAKLVVKREPPAPPASQPASSAADPSAPPPPAPDATDKWTLLEGSDRVGGKMDPNIAVNLAAALSRVEADDFVPDPKPEATGFDHPRATVTAFLKDGGNQVALVLGKTEGDSTYIKRGDGDRVWKIHNYDADRLAMSPPQWRDKTLLTIAPNDVSRIEIVKGSDHLVLERADKDKPWRATTPKDFGDVDGTKVNPMLSTASQLVAAKVVETPDAKAHGLDKPQGQVTFSKKAADGTFTTLGSISFGGKVNDNEYYIRLGDKGDEYTLPSYQTGQLLKAPAELKKGGTTAAKAVDKP
jgi:uncharacterized protein DUF4340